MTFVDRHDLVRPDATVRYWTGGAAGRQTVVLLHGATLDHRAWAPQVEALGARLVTLGKKPGIRLGTRRRFREALATLRPDVLHTHQVGALFYAGPAARAAGVPVVVHTEHINNIRKAGGGRT